MALILLGIGLFIAGAFAITQLDFLSMLFCYGFGVFCIIMGWRKISPPKQQDQTPPPPIYKPSAQNIEQKPLVIDTSPVQKPIKEPEPPKRKVSYHKTFSVAGVTFDCIHNENYDNRQDVLNASRTEDKLVLEEYTYKGSPAFLIINERLGADIGNVPAWAVDKVIEIRKKYDTELVFYSFRWFEVNDADSDNSDDGGDDSDNDYEYYTESQERCSCRVRINGYKKQ